jgi:MinD-like ATPase involved in chromosome partitioning or flagellar assembly
MERPTVLLALANDLAGTAEALRRAGFDPLFTEEAADQLTRGHVPEMAVLDCDQDPAEVRAIHEWLHHGRAVPTILLFSTEPPDFATVVDEYAAKPCPPEALIYRLQALLIRTGHQLPGDASAAIDGGLADAPMMGEGHVVSVFAPKGGVGKTTVAVNVAIALRQQTRDRVLLFDADVGVGNVTAVLDVGVKMGLADLADSAPEQWTDAAFEHVTMVHEQSGLRVLTWGNDPGQSELVTVDLLLTALRWAKAHHAYVIVDNHPGYDDRTLAMLTLATEIFLVVTPEVGAIRNSAQFLELAREIGLGDVVRVIVNRANHGISLEDMASTLGLPISATIVSNGPKAVLAANQGEPVIDKFPKERISQDLHNVARLVTRRGIEPAPQTSRPWWLRLGARTSNA